MMHSHWKNWGRRVLFAVMLASTACGTPEVQTPAPGKRVTTGRVQPGEFEAFEAHVPRNPITGMYLVEGDVPIPDREALRAYYESIREGSSALSQRRLTARWSDSMRRNLTYCVSTDFGHDHQRVVEAMEEATRAWENVVDVDFIYRPQDDADCSGDAPDGIVFGVVKAGALENDNIDADAYAFYPDFPSTLWDVTILDGGLVARGDLPGLLRHELGHVLGFQHEHLRSGSGVSADCSTEPDSYVPPYGNLPPVDLTTEIDFASIMFYEPCGGISEGRLSPLDVEGAQKLYPPAQRAHYLVGDFNKDGLADASWFAPATREFVVQFSVRNGDPILVTQDVSAWGRVEAATHFSVGDFNGDGADDWLWYAHWDRRFHVMLSNRGGGWTERPVDIGGVPKDNDAVHATNFQVGDFNGDGIDDWSWVKSGALMMRLSFQGSTGVNWYPASYWSSTLGIPRHMRVGNFTNSENDKGDDWSWYSQDTNEFLVLRYLEGAGVFRLTSSTTGGWGPWGSGRHFRTGDYNGDGFMDWSWYAPWSNDFIVMLSSGDGHYQAVSNNTSSWGTWTAGRHFRTGDYNGDGRTDWSWYAPWSNEFIVMSSSGDGHFQAAGQNTSGWGNWSAGWFFSVGDSNGDGYTDWSWYAPWTNDSIVMYSDGSGGWTPVGRDVFQLEKFPSGIRAHVEGVSTAPGVKGWAYDLESPDQPLTLHAYFDGPAGSGARMVQATTSVTRDDVNSTFGISGTHGFSIPVPPEYFDGLQHTVYVYAIDPQGRSNPQLRGSPTSFVLHGAEGHVERITDDGYVEGWALDYNSLESSVSVHFYVDGPPGIGTFVGSMLANGYRPDLNGVWGGSAPHGFRFLLPTPWDGTPHTVYVYALDVQQRNNALLDGQGYPYRFSAVDGQVERVTADGYLEGWAVDPQAKGSSLYVHIYIDGPAGSGTLVSTNTLTSIYRADVNTSQGATGQHGFQFAIPEQYLDGMRHSVYVYGIDLHGTYNPLLPGSPLYFTIDPGDFGGDGGLCETRPWMC